MSEQTSDVKEREVPSEDLKDESSPPNPRWHWALALLTLLIYTLYFYKNLWLDLNGPDSKHLVQWDTHWYHWPILVYVSDCFRAGELPYWLPFMSTGYPIIGDPQSQMWSPITLLISFTVGYSLWVLQIQMLLQVIAAAFGCFFLGRSMKWGPLACLAFGASYVSAGHFLSTFQYFGIMTVYQALPWFLLGIRWFIKEPTWWKVGVMALAVGTLGHAGHPGTFLIINLNLGIVALAMTLLRRQPRIKALAMYLLALGVAGGMIWVMAGSTLAIAKYTNRIGHEYTYHEIMVLEALFPRSLVSAISPSAAVVEARALFVADIAMNNHYLGVLLLIGLFAVLGTRLTAWQAGALVLAVLNFLAALGHYGYVRWLVAKLPLFDSIHHPAANFRGFAFFFIMLVVFDWFNRVARFRFSGATIYDRFRRSGLQVGLAGIVGCGVTLYILRQVLAHRSPVQLATFVDFPVFVALACAIVVLLVVAVWSRRGAMICVPLVLAISAADLSRAGGIGWVTVAENQGPEKNAASWAKYRDWEARRPGVLAFPADPPRIDNRAERYADNATWITRDSHFVKNINQMRLVASDKALADEAVLNQLLLGPEKRRPIYFRTIGGTGNLIPVRDAKVLEYGANHLKLELPESLISDGEILIGEAWFPGWGFAYEGGDSGQTQPADEGTGYGRAFPYRADGPRVVTLRFRPEFFARYAAVSLVSLLVALGLVATKWIRLPARGGKPEG